MNGHIGNFQLVNGCPLTSELINQSPNSTGISHFYVQAEIGTSRWVPLCLSRLGFDAQRLAWLAHPLQERPKTVVPQKDSG